MMATQGGNSMLAPQPTLPSALPTPVGQPTNLASELVELGKRFETPAESQTPTEVTPPVTLLVPETPVSEQPTTPAKPVQTVPSIPSCRPNMVALIQQASQEVKLKSSATCGLHLAFCLQTSNAMTPIVLILQTSHNQIHFARD
jgi:hypothetical protein